MPPTSWSIPSSSRDASSTGLALSGTRMSLAGPTVAWEAGCMPRLVGRNSPRLPKGRRLPRKPCGIELRRQAGLLGAAEFLSKPVDFRLVEDDAPAPA